MTHHLVIVESPAKAKTIKKYLGNDFEIIASYGHVRDLLPKEGAVDTADDFKMRYELIKKNEKHVDTIVSAMKKADALYLATDPDREGEAISWHIYTILKTSAHWPKSRCIVLYFMKLLKQRYRQQLPVRAKFPWI